MHLTNEIVRLNPSVWTNDFNKWINRSNTTNEEKTKLLGLTQKVFKGLENSPPVLGSVFAGSLKAKIRVTHIRNREEQNKLIKVVDDFFKRPRTYNEETSQVRQRSRSEPAHPRNESLTENKSSTDSPDARMQAAVQRTLTEKTSASSIELPKAPSIQNVVEESKVEFKRSRNRTVSMTSFQSEFFRNNVHSPTHRSSGLRFGNKGMRRK